MSTYWCQMQLPDGSQNSPPAPSNLICSTVQPTRQVTVIQRHDFAPAWIELLTILAVVAIVITISVWRYSTVTDSNYRNRKQRQFEHEEHIAQLEVEKQQAIANQIYPPLPEEKPKRK